MLATLRQVKVQGPPLYFEVAGNPTFCEIHVNYLQLMLGSAKVNQLDDAICSHHDVSALDIPTEGGKRNDLNTTATDIANSVCVSACACLRVYIL